MKETKERTVDEFVEDMISSGRTRGQILQVVQSTHWKNKMEEIKEAITKLEKRLAKSKQKTKK